MPIASPSLRFRFLLPIAAVTLLSAFAPPARLHAEPPAAKTVHGELIQVDGVTVLRVWGDARERGFAHGWLMAEQIVKLTDAFIRTFEPLGGAKGFEKAAAMCRGLMVVEPDYEAELRGLIAGVEARLGDKAVIPVLKRKGTYIDIMTLNAFADLGRLGCSSFAAWGKATTDGETISGRNLDWFGDASEALTGGQIVVAQLPRYRNTADYGSSGDSDLPTAQGWVSLTWPGLTICLTGMNSDGVTLSMHDSGGRGKWLRPRSTPRGYVIREALEFVRPTSILDDISGVLRNRHTVVGNNFPVSFPSTGGSPASIVFEYDGDQKNSSGFTIRGGDGGATGDRSGEQSSDFYQTCTNHYRSRDEATRCERYDTLRKRLDQAHGGSEKIDVAAGWKMLDDVSMFGRVKTYHSVVFEPNKRRMHVAFSDGKQSATKCKHHTLDVAALLKGGSATVAAKPTPAAPVSP